MQYYGLPQKLLRVGWLLTLLSLMLVGLSGISAQDDFTLVWAYERGPSEIDPHDTRGTPDLEIALFMTHNMLTRLTPNEASLVEPDLAESWTVSEDGRTYTFTLRQGVMFWDEWGEMTADDVVFSIERAKANTNLVASSIVTRFVESATAVDPYTVEIVLNDASPAFLASLASSYNMAIISRAAYESLGPEQFRLYPVGTGPYKPVNWNPGEGITLEAHENYFRGVPEIGRVQLVVQPDETATVLALQSGEVNFAIVRGTSMWEALENSEGVTLNYDPDISTNILMFFVNTTRGALTDARVRQALVLGLDREAMSDSIGQGLSGGVAHTILPRSLFGHSEDVAQYPYDPDRARELLAEAGYGDGVDLVAVTHRSGVYVPVLEAAQAYWSQIGVNLQIDVVERLERNDRLNSGDFDINIQDVGRIEPSQFLGEFFHSSAMPPTGRAYSRFSTPELDALIEAQNSELDPDVRRGLILQAQEIIANEMPYVPLWYLVNVTAHSDFLEGEMPNLYSWNARFSALTVNR